MMTNKYFVAVNYKDEVYPYTKLFTDLEEATDFAIDEFVKYNHSDLFVAQINTDADFYDENMEVDEFVVQIDSIREELNYDPRAFIF